MLKNTKSTESTFFPLSPVKLTASFHSCCFSGGTKSPAAQEGSTDPSHPPQSPGLSPAGI